MARQQNKQIDLIIEGEETELDKTVLEQMYDPLVHLLRNAVDHGIESPEIREKLGKPPAGRIWLLSRYEKGGVLIEVADDGGGIDPEKIREVAVSKGLLTQEEARLMSDDLAIRFMFTPGFSTSRQGLGGFRPWSGYGCRKGKRSKVARSFGCRDRCRKRNGDQDPASSDPRHPGRSPG